MSRFALQLGSFGARTKLQMQKLALMPSSWPLQGEEPTIAFGCSEPMDGLVWSGWDETAFRHEPGAEPALAIHAHTLATRARRAREGVYA